MARVSHTKPTLTYESWIAALRLDPEIRPEMLEFIPEGIFIEWWEEGLAPTRKAIAAAENYRITRAKSAS